MKKKLITGLVLLLILATVIGTFALAVDSYHYDMDPQNGVDIFEGVSSILILIAGSFVVLYELDLWYTVSYFLFRQKTAAKTILNLLANMTFLSVFICCIYQPNSNSLKSLELTLLFLFFLYIILRVISILLPAVTPKRKKKHRYDRQGFDSNKIHRNGTKFDDSGFDFYGYDAEGYNKEGYDRKGKNRELQYNRFFDTTSCEQEGFCDPKVYPIVISDHAKKRFCERFGISDPAKMRKFANDAYRFGKSKRQIKKTSSYLVEEIEQKDGGSIVLIYHNVIYIFTYDNELKTLYKNEKIPL